MGSPNFNDPRLSQVFSQLTQPQAQAPPANPLESWHNYAQSIPEEVPNNVYDALREKFFDEQVAQGVLSQGFGLEPARREFMDRTERPKVSRERAFLTGASKGLLEPLKFFGAPEAAEAEESAKLGERDRPLVSALGGMVGTTPYFVGPFEAAGAIGKGLEAGHALQAGINATAGALVQGAYDAAKAPAGTRLLQGAKGALVGGATVGAFEGAGALFKLMRGVASEPEATEAAEQVMNDPQVEQKIAAETQQAAADAKKAGVPAQASVGRSNGKVEATVKASDGKTYTVPDPVAQAPLIAQHLDAGGSLETLSGDPNVATQVLRKIESEQAARGAFDTNAGPNDAARPEFRAPEYLTKLKPSYGMNQLDFASDLDRIAYLWSAKTPGLEDIASNAAEHLGVTPEALADLGKGIRTYVRAHIGEAEDGVLSIPSILGPDASANAGAMFSRRSDFEKEYNAREPQPTGEPLGKLLKVWDPRGRVVAVFQAASDMRVMEDGRIFSGVDTSEVERHFPLERGYRFEVLPDTPQSKQYLEQRGTWDLKGSKPEDIQFSRRGFASRAGSLTSNDFVKPEPNWTDYTEGAPEQGGDFESKNLGRVRYDPASQELQVHFKSGHAYQYSDVPPTKVNEMINAESPGSYFAKQIKPFSKLYSARQVAAPSGVPPPAPPEQDLETLLQQSIDQTKGPQLARRREQAFWIDPQGKRTDFDLYREHSDAVPEANIEKGWIRVRDNSVQFSTDHYDVNNLYDAVRSAIDASPNGSAWVSPYYSDIRFKPGTSEPLQSGYLKTVTVRNEDLGEFLSNPKKFMSERQGGRYNFDRVVRERGAAPLPLSDEGIQHALELAQQSAVKGGFDEIHSGPTPRHTQTADFIESTSPFAQRFAPDDALGSWNHGFEGQPHDRVIEAMNELVQHPDGSVPGGESINSFAKRFLPKAQALAQHAEESGKKVAAVVSSRDIGMLSAWIEAGRPADWSFDPETMMAKHENPGDVYAWDGADNLRQVDMQSDADFEPGQVHFIRHAETEWNAPRTAEGTDEFTPMKQSAAEGGATYKETPLAHRYSGNIPFLDEANAQGAAITPLPGEKPSLFYAHDADRQTLFEENFHGHVGYLGLRPWLRDMLESEHGGMIDDIADGMGLREGYSDRPQDIPEETFIKVAKAVRTADQPALEDLAAADSGMDSLLSWTNEVSNRILDETATLTDSLHKRTLERRLNAVVARATRSLDEMNQPFAASSPASLDLENGRWLMRLPGSARYFDSREDALAHMEENYAEPLNSPELLDLDRLPDRLPRWSRDLAGPNVAGRPPITSDPPPTEVRADSEVPQLGGFSLIGRYFRPFYDWLADQSERIKRPDLWDAFHPIDKATVEMNNFMRPYTEALKDTVGQLHLKDQSRFFKLVQTLPQDRVAVAKELGFDNDDLDVFEEFNKRFANPLESELGVSLEDFVRNILPRTRAKGYDAVFPKPPLLGQRDPFGAYNEALKVGEISPHDENLLRVAANYMRVGARDKYLGDLLNAATKIVDEKNADGSFRLGLLRTSLARHVEYLRGIPDHTSQVLNSIAADAMSKINKGIELVNKALPERLQLEPFDDLPQEALNKFILFSYAGELALRPALLVRDAMQLFLTTLPVLGKYTWSGLERAFPAIKEGASSDVWKVPQRYGALIESKDLQNLYSAGGEEEAGRFEKFAEKAMSLIQFSHNSNRLVAFWGHEAKAADALESFLDHGDTKQLVKDSGMWFMKPAMQRTYTREAQLFDSRLSGFEEQSQDWARRVAKEMVELTQWNFKRGANPGIYEYQLGRLFGQYGTWPLNYIEYARRFATSSDRAESLKALTRLVLTHVAVQSAGAAAGVDLSSWLWTSPMAYGGGPALEVLTSIPQSMDFETQRGSEARSEIRRAFFPGIVPGGEAAEQVWKAVSSNDPNLWVRMMGFTPLEGRSELRQ